MLGKNNIDGKLRKVEPQKQRFSIRKFAIGAASVVIGLTFMGMGNQTVKADVAPATVQTNQTQTQDKKVNVDNEEDKNVNDSEKVTADQTNVKTSSDTTTKNGADDVAEEADSSKKVTEKTDSANSAVVTTQGLSDKNGG